MGYPVYCYTVYRKKNKWELTLFISDFKLDCLN